MAKKISLSDVILFDWDEGNLRHIKKHAVESRECEDIFFNKTLYFEDTRHSSLEIRFLAYGITNEKRLLTIVFTIRNNKVRVVSARDQHKKERAIYEQGEKK